MYHKKVDIYYSEGVSTPKRGKIKKEVPKFDWWKGLKRWIFPLF
jgi:hypothetical protein